MAIWPNWLTVTALYGSQEERKRYEDKNYVYSEVKALQCSSEKKNTKLKKTWNILHTYTYMLHINFNNNT